MPDDSLQPAPRLPAPGQAGDRPGATDRGTLPTLFLGIIAGVAILAALDAARLIAVPTVLALLGALVLAPSVR